MLPYFVPIRLFTLEFIRQILNVGKLNFVLAKKGHLFKFPKTIGPFIVNNKQVMK